MIISSRLIQIFLKTQGICNAQAAFGSSFPLTKVTYTKQIVLRAEELTELAMDFIWELSSLVPNSE